jgi:hypothetical protein
MKNSLKIIFAALLLAGCNKTGPVECDYVVTPYFQDEQNGPVEVAADAMGYLFYADTTDWLPVDYDQAAAGTISSRKGGGTLDFDMRAATGEDYALSFSPVMQKTVMLVVCFPATRSWAVRQAPMEGGIAQINASVTLRAWQAESPYKDSRWDVWNQNPPVRVDCDITAAVQLQAESDGPLAPAEGAVGYAFAADTAGWRVASLTDALEGRLTSATSSAQTLDFEVRAIAGSLPGELFFEGVSRRRVTLVVAHETSRLYAVKQIELTYGLNTLSVPLTMPQSDKWPAWNDGWKITYQAPAPPPEEPEE